ncbi:MAG: hypothetical protein K2L70_01035 [Clostridia bacterium]|nr:hypothetical protein [Clostridia bacterium]
MQSQILKIFYEIEENQINLDKELYEKQLDEVIKCQQLLQKSIGDNEELRNLFNELDDAMGTYHSTMLSGYYVEGFKCGAKIALEIFGEDK